MQQPESAVTMRRLWAFFLPLGVSASLVTLSHVIINSTLARSPQPELVISSYAIAMSLLTITERPAVLLRQTCSALVRDTRSFRSMLAVARIVFACILAFGFAVCYTPAGGWIFGGLFGVGEDKLAGVIQVYRVLMFVSIFSGLRCLYQGVIIYNQRTKWLTIGMSVRLAVMYLLSQYYIRTGVESGAAGAVIFLAGMMVEAAVSYAEGRSLVRRMPEKSPRHAVETKRHVFVFYKPLLVSAFITVVIVPSINAMLGKTPDPALAVSSFAVAGSLVMLMTSFFSYFHQIVLNFHQEDPAAVRRFTLSSGFLPAVLIGAIAFTPAGEWFLAEVMAVRGELLRESVRALQAFVLMALVMPWLDALNGLVLLRGQTKLILGSQTVNLVFTLGALILLLAAGPAPGGTTGAWAQSAGLAAEFVFVALRLRSMKPADTLPAGGSTRLGSGQNRITPSERNRQR